jgi:hypothetical protein
LAALAAFAALKLKSREAVLSIGGVWLINQLVGFGCSNYPRTPECVAWGIGMGLAASMQPSSQPCRSRGGFK